MTGALLESHRLPDGVDITKDFVLVILKWQRRLERAGVQLKRRHVPGSPGTEARLINVVMVEPGTDAGYGAAHLVSSPGRDD